MLTTIVIAAAFIGVAAMVGGIAFIFRGDDNSNLEDRLAVLTAKGGAGAVAKSSEATLLTKPLNTGPSVIEECLSRILNVRLFLEQADVGISPAQFAAIVGGLSVGGAVICVVFPAIPTIAAPAAAVVLAALPPLWLFLKRRRRLAAFGRQLPEALELISRALRAGHSLAAGISLVGSEMSAPVGKEFSRCYEEQNLGIPLEETLENLAERVPNLDLRFFVTAIVLQRQTGGDLAEILDKIGHLIRERFKIWGQIQALTGEGRLSGIVLLALPPVLFVVMWRINPQYCEILFNDPLGHQMLAVAIVMQFIGAAVIKKIITIKV
jgi:tight adherence protein B